MATITPVITQQSSVYGHSTVVTWSNIGDADTCAAIQMQPFADRSVHVYAAAFGGATISIKGSNEPTGDFSALLHGASLHDPQGVALTFTSEKIETVSEFTNWIWPVTASGSSSNITVAIMFRNIL